jgi:N-acetylglucosaminyl-diphospho-decaprenol L-rhamnosyltransferase
MPSIAISLVSHGHGGLTEQLVCSLLECSEIGQVILTKNIPESLRLPADERITLVENDSPAGFAANHNAAFDRCRFPYFCSINPDIAFSISPFAELLHRFEAAADLVMVAPLVVSSNGGVEDSVRHFPTPIGILRKLVLGDRGTYAIQPGMADFGPDWIAGMFMLFRSEAYRRLGGFDSGFFLYYEDVDICVRIWRAGMRLLVCPTVTVVHDARRDSHRRFKYLYWHLSSMFRYFVKHMGGLPSVPDPYGTE